MTRSVMLILLFFSFTVVADDSNRHLRIVGDLSAEEVDFLKCSTQCASAISGEESIFQCLEACRKDNHISPENLSEFMSIGVGIGVTEDECLATTNFVCPLFEKKCCCEGFFDCKQMEQIVKGCDIKSCTAQDGREICTCILK